MKRIAAIVGTVLLAAVLGIGTAVVRVRYLFEVNDTQVGPWRASKLLGSPQAGATLRAGIAVNAILALNRHEAIYYSAATDDDGRPLSGQCRYTVSGTDLPARWWSLTAYGADRFLIPNPDHRYSVTRDTASRLADGNFAVPAGATGTSASWIASGTGPFSLTLRAYGPDASIGEAPGAAQLPHIVRGSCQ